MGKIERTADNPNRPREEAYKQMVEGFLAGPVSTAYIGKTDTERSLIAVGVPLDATQQAIFSYREPAVLVIHEKGIAAPLPTNKSTLGELSVPETSGAETPSSHDLERTLSTQTNKSTLREPALVELLGMQNQEPPSNGAIVTVPEGAQFKDLVHDLWGERTVTVVDQEEDLEYRMSAGDPMWKYATQALRVQTILENESGK